MLKHNSRKLNNSILSFAIHPITEIETKRCLKSVAVPMSCLSFLAFCTWHRTLKAFNASALIKSVEKRCINVFIVSKSPKHIAINLQALSISIEAIDMLQPFGNTCVVSSEMDGWNECIKYTTRTVATHQHHHSVHNYQFCENDTNVGDPASLVQWTLFTVNRFSVVHVLLMRKIVFFPRIVAETKCVNRTFMSDT